MKILLVENDRKIGQFIKKGLEEVAYPTTLANSCATGMDAFFEGNFDVVILDLGLGDGDGMDLLAAWRHQKFQTPVLILSARGDINDKVNGLNLGADDYLAKPFSFAELLARIRSLGRRQSGQSKTLLRHGSLQMDLISREISLDGQSLELTPREFALLEMFLQNIGRVLTRTQIIEKIWDVYFDMETNLLDVYISKLRTKLVSDDSDTVKITTIRGVGYRFEK
ncbi:MAG: response regulator transcription factor [Akkermansiaceae bacterium]|jgi:DNA-binding response OmpR family regulator|nr:response regulator transcription factor [Akkermansiaceae bacterium]